MLSIIYITRNRSEELARSIVSCEERVSITHEYVIIDNGSTDNTKNVIDKFISQGMDIKYFLQDENHGVAGGRNIGFQKSSGDICYFIDDDAVIGGEGLILDKAYNFITMHDSIYAMGTDCYDTKLKTQLIGTSERHHAQNTMCRISGYRGGSHFIKKNCFHTDYLYPDNLLYGSEELYVALTVFADGGNIVQYPDLKIIHTPSSNTRTDLYTRNRNMYVNQYVIKKYFLRFPYNVISKIMFLLRLIKFEKVSVKNIRNDYKLVKERYDRKYTHYMSNVSVKKYIKLFGMTNIL